MLRFFCGGALLVALMFLAAFSGAGLARAGGAEGSAWALAGFAGPLALGAAIGGWGLTVSLSGTARALAARDLAELERSAARHRHGTTCLGAGAMLLPAALTGALAGAVVGALSPLSALQGALRLGSVGVGAGLGLLVLARLDLFDLRGGRDG